MNSPYQQEQLAIVQKYFEATGQSLPERYTWPDVVQWRWEAAAYNGERGFYTRLENAPRVNDTLAYVVNRKGVKQYVCRYGEWVYIGNVTKEMYEG